ncbi:hypothetical protein U1Q18_045817 [Sarracenia purpurea var. burkii]
MERNELRTRDIRNSLEEWMDEDIGSDQLLNKKVNGQNGEEFTSGRIYISPNRTENQMGWKQGGVVGCPLVLMQGDRMGQQPKPEQFEESTLMARKEAGVTILTRLLGGN